MQLTKHAQKRMAQRGLTEEDLALIAKFGRRQHDHRGGVIVYLDRRAKKQLRERCPGPLYRRLAEKRCPYYVERACGERAGEVITAGHRHKRVYR